VLRAFLESQAYREQFEVVAINELADHKTLAHLLKYDSTHGRLNAEVSLEGDKLHIVAPEFSYVVQLFNEESADTIQWPDVDLLLECSGTFSDRQTAEKHLSSGANKLLFSQPAEADVDCTVVYGVNHELLKPGHRIVSNASCTTNAITPVLKIIDQAFSVKAGTITTLHSAMNDQPVIDAYHNTDLRKTRAAFNSMIPVNTELAKGIARIMPVMEGRFVAHAIRVPTMNVSALDVSLQLNKSVSVTEVNQLLQMESGSVANVLAVTSEPLASCDFNHDSHSVIVDASQTQVVDQADSGSLVKLLLWFDNEWAFAKRMLDVAALM
jgi:glyceraldehyde-3-phosphate dehydrogenase type I